MQNSGLGNAVNPLASLMDAQVYQLPCLLVVGWRGEPGVHDEPQHVKQGQITLSQLEILGVPYRILSKDTTEEQFAADFAFLREQLNQRQCAALVVRKGALTCSLKARVRQRKHPHPRAGGGNHAERDGCGRCSCVHDGETQPRNL